MKNGFTLIEVLLCIILISILAAISIPTYYTLFPRNDLDVAKNQLVQSLRRAEILSLASDGDSTWGVQIQSGSMVIFKGLSYSLRNINYDEIYQVNSDVVPSGLSSVVFNKLTGFPQTSGTIILTGINGEKRTITVSITGTVSY